MSDESFHPSTPSPQPAPYIDLPEVRDDDEEGDDAGSDGSASLLGRAPRWVWFLAVALLVVAAGVGARACGAESSEEQATVLADEGLQAMNVGEWVRARDLYRKAAEKDARNVFAEYNLGLIAQTREFDEEQAEAYYRRTLELDPEFGGALYNLAIIRTSAGDRDEAIRLYRRAITAHPDFADAFLNLGLLLKDNPATAAEAQTLLRKAAELDPSLKERVASYTDAPPATSSSSRS